MGTRADFYVHQSGGDFSWIGSLSMDGYPEDENGEGVPKALMKSATMQDFYLNVRALLNNHPTTAIENDHWPWPWKDSTLTDYSYVYDVNAARVVVCHWGCHIGGKWRGTQAFEWPDMSSRRDPNFWKGNNRFRKSGMTVMVSNGVGVGPTLLQGT